ncbi:MAG: SOS response-associated peptidase [Candidatus Thorarchaeota archaeon]|nr:SOS response-associated peptidase [Candidatus Thorarchaeota archaeon]
MCGRFNFLTHKKEVQDRFGIKTFEYEVVPKYNIAPTQQVAVVVYDSGTKLVGMRWGLIPFWAKDPKIGNRMINARAETLDQKRVFINSFKEKRCLILSTGFYEWQKLGKIKRPMHIRLKTKGPFAFAGIYSHWKTPTDKTILSCSIVTTSPNELLTPIHDRMPVILKQENEEFWLNPENEDLAAMKAFLSPYPSDLMEAYEVSTYVNSPTNTGPQCTQPLVREAL